MHRQPGRLGAQTTYSLSGGGGREGRSDLAPGLPDDLSPLRGRCRRRRCRRRRFHGSSGPAVVSARDEAPCFGSVAGLHRVLQRGDIEASVGTTLAPPASHSRSSASVGGRQQQPLGPPLLRVLQ